MILRLTFICSLLMYSFAHAEWEPLAPLPTGNGGFACGVLDGRLIAAGGTTWKDDVKLWLDVIWSYDPATNQWSTIGRLPYPCSYAGSGVINGKLIIAGGSDGTIAHKHVIAVDGRGKCLNLGELPEGRVYSAAAVVDGELFLAGGSTDPVELKTFTNTVFRVSFPNGGVKVKIEPSLGDIGFGIASAAPAWKRAFVFGGCKYDAVAQVINLNAIHVLNAPNTQGHLEAPIRGLSAVPISEHHIYLAGGYPSDEQGFVDQAWIFTGTTGTLTPALALPIKSMVHFATDGEWVYCLGGEDKKKHRNDRMWRIRAKDLLAPLIVK